MSNRIPRHSAPWLSRVFEKAIGIDHVMSVGPHSLRLPSDHALPDYQRIHPTYDAFLPFLAKQLEPNAWIIDVGANCADTLVSMIAQNPQLHFVCFEPDPRFLKYLHANLESARRNGYSNTVHVVEKAVGTQPLHGTWNHASGTGRLDPHAPNTSAQPTLEVVRLDTTFTSLVPNTSPTLIKSDVDGLDPDVILSAGNLLHDNPLVYLECDPHSDDQRAQYLQLFEELSRNAFQHFFAFDNFGFPILHTSDPQQLSQLLSYCAAQRLRKQPAIYYLDVLACKAPRFQFTQSIVQQYTASLPSYFAP